MNPKKSGSKCAFTHGRHASKFFRILFVLFYCSPITQKPAKSIYLQYIIILVASSRAARRVSVNAP